MRILPKRLESALYVMFAVFVLVFLFALRSPAASGASYLAVAGSKHDISGRGCPLCHLNTFVSEEDTQDGFQAGTMRCMSCHEESLGAARRIGLKGGHPVDIAYKYKMGETATPEMVQAAGLKLYGIEGKIQCGTCHDPHDRSKEDFLRVRADRSQICLVCHINVP